MKRILTTPSLSLFSAQGATDAAGAQGQSVSIAQVEKDNGWSSSGWQNNLMENAAKLGGDSSGGDITAGAIDAYLSNPVDGNFYTSSNLVQAEADVSSSPKAVGSMPTPWEQTLAGRADKDGNSDGRVTSAELQTEADDIVKASFESPAQSGPVWVPDQEQAALESAIAERTGEGDPLHPQGDSNGQTTLLKSYMRIREDDAKRDPVYVGYELSGADLAIDDQATADGVVKRKRTNDFREDPAYPNGPTKDDYHLSGYDQGHQKPASDAPNMDAMHECFLLTNMAPQTNELNSHSWEMLEQGTQELTRATGGKAVVFTGSLWLDSNGNPTPPTTWIGANGQARVAVPTHSWKTVLLKRKDGQLNMYAYVVPNLKTMPTTKADADKLLAQSRVSVDQLQKLTGLNFFPGLPAAQAQALESDATPVIKVPGGKNLPDVMDLWPNQ